MKLNREPNTERLVYGMAVILALALIVGFRVDDATGSLWASEGVTFGLMILLSPLAFLWSLRKSDR